MFCSSCLHLGRLLKRICGHIWCVRGPLRNTKPGRQSTRSTQDEYEAPDPTHETHDEEQPSSLPCAGTWEQRVAGLTYEIQALNAKIQEKDQELQRMKENTMQKLKIQNEKYVKAEKKAKENDRYWQLQLAEARSQHSQVLDRAKRQVEQAKSESRELRKANEQISNSIEHFRQLNSKLMQELAQSSNRVTESRHDDRYIEKSLSILFCSIQDWVLRYFSRNSYDDENVFRKFRKNVQKYLKSIGPEWQPVLNCTNHPYHHLLVQAMLGDYIREWIFGRTFLGFAEEEFKSLNSMVIDQSALTPEERFKWHRSTIDLLVKHPSFSIKRAEKIEKIVDGLLNFFSPLMKPKALQHPRTRTTLRTIIEQSAQLTLECHQEPAIFSFNEVVAQMPFQSHSMMDVENRGMDQDLEAQGIPVTLVVFPMVIRKSLDCSTEVIISKARVLTSHPNIAADYTTGNHEQPLRALKESPPIHNNINHSN